MPTRRSRASHESPKRDDTIQRQTDCQAAWIGVMVLLVGADCGLAASPILLRDVSASVGIAFRHSDGSRGCRYIVETVASGLATFDYDGDGLCDVYFLTGGPISGDAAGTAGEKPTNQLYRNLGEWQFADVTSASGLGCAKFGLGLGVADYDEDGFPDVYVSNYGPNLLFRNNGDGTFSDVTATSGTGGQLPTKVGAGVCFLDVDNDGDADLFVADYLAFSVDRHLPRSFRGMPIYRGPEAYPPLSATLFRNEGDGSFTDGTRAAGLDAPSWGMGVIGADFDDDGDTDIFVANDGAGNFLWQNDGRGRFQDVGLLAGVAFNLRGDAEGTWGSRPPTMTVTASSIST